MDCTASGGTAEPFPGGRAWLAVHALVRTAAGWRSRRLVEELLWDRRSE